MQSRWVAVWSNGGLLSTLIYIAPFRSGLVSSTAPTAFTDVDDWPYDNGDDPSFRAMRKFDGQLTWGVCRQDVRNAISQGDIAVFFSFRKIDNRQSEYRLCSVATVERKVSQADIWQKESLSVFRKYCNLLIQPSKSKGLWEHFEPCLQGTRIHKDWLWRIANHDGLRTTQFDNIHASNLFKEGNRIGESPIELAPNYVIFSSDSTRTRTLFNPPVVARYLKGQVHEEWNEDEFSSEIRKLTLKEAERVSGIGRWLRTENTQFPHRHIVFELAKENAENWRADILRVVSRR